MKKILITIFILLIVFTAGWLVSFFYTNMSYNKFIRKLEKTSIKCKYFPAGTKIEEEVNYISSQINFPIKFIFGSEEIKNRKSKYSNSPDSCPDGVLNAYWYIFDLENHYVCKELFLENNLVVLLEK